MNTFSTTVQRQIAAKDIVRSNLRDPVISLITQGFAVVKLPLLTQSNVWSAMERLAGASPEMKQNFSFPERTDGFLPKGGEYSKYTGKVDLCDRFCFWHRYRELHAPNIFSKTTAYRDVSSCEEQLASLAQQLISELWAFFHSDEQIVIRNNSYLQLCIYEEFHQLDDRNYMQDRHEDGHLITLIKPTRDGLVIFPNDIETPVHLADDEIIIISGSLLTLLSDGQIPAMYHAVSNPKIPLARKSMVYFAIPDLSQTYTSLLSKKRLNVADFADESHRAFGNTSLL